MQNTLYLFFLITLASLTQAQNQVPSTERCSTVPYNEAQYRANPMLRTQHEALKQKITQRLAEKNSMDSIGVVTIPVVVHVLWNTEAQNISDAQIYSQIAVLNEDFRRLNADAVNTPSQFDTLVADCYIEFCLAKRNPDSVTTDGIERKYTTVTAFQMDNTMKSETSGGLNAWNPDKYLNLWVCNMAGNILGYASFPGGTDSVDGVVIHYHNFGRIGDLDPHYNLGRTATHEVGHWLDLYHIWGDDDGSCDGSDYVEDTPNAKNANYFCPTHPRITICNSEGEMFMNYMDYTDDDCLNAYTHGQKARMWAALSLARPTLFTSDGCSPIIGIAENEWLSDISVYPNPGQGIFNIALSLTHPQPIRIRVTDVLGNVILQEDFTAENSSVTEIDLSHRANGFYFLQVMSSAGTHSEKILLSR